MDLNSLSSFSLFKNCVSFSIVWLEPIYLDLFCSWDCSLFFSILSIDAFVSSLFWGLFSSSFFGVDSSLIFLISIFFKYFSPIGWYLSSIIWSFSFISLFIDSSSDSSSGTSIDSSQLEFSGFVLSLKYNLSSNSSFHSCSKGLRLISIRE